MISQPIANTVFYLICFFRKVKFANSLGDGLLFYAKIKNFKHHTSEFLQLNENTGYFWGMSFCLNNGTVEWWNSGFLNDINSLNIYHQAAILPVTQSCSIPTPIFPISQHSTIPSGARPQTWYVTYLYYKSDYSSTQIDLQTGQRISLVFRNAQRFQTGCTSTWHYPVTFL